MAPNQFLENGLVAEQIMLNDGKVVYFGPELAVTSLYSSVPCDIKYTSPPYFDVSLAWALQKNSPFLGLFNDRLNLFRETGMVDRYSNYKSN